jgi:hypothetical protein
MESFRAAVDRLSKIFVSDLLAAVRAAATEQLAQQQKKEARPKPTRILRPSNTASASERERPVVVRSFDIPVGQPRRPRRRASGTAPVRKAAPPPPQPQVVKFEVVPHPERKNRRIVMTRVEGA